MRVGKCELKYKSCELNLRVASSSTAKFRSKSNWLGKKFSSQFSSVFVNWAEIYLP